MKRVGRYVMHDEIASGGMGAVHLGRALGSAGFSRIVAIKRLHPHLAAAPESVAAFTDEARLSARVHHPNVVATLDVVDHERELCIVMDYVHGASLASLARAAKSADLAIPVGVAVAVVIDVLTGLQAIHDATNELGEPLSIVHRDISPQNVLVGADGVARVVDFGIAKAAVRLQTTTFDGSIKGKLRYMAPEQLLDLPVDPRTDAFSASVVLWELLTGMPLFDASNDGAIVARVLEGVVVPPSRCAPEISPELDAVVLRALSRTSDERFASCRAMVVALREAVAPAPAEDVSRWVQTLAGDLLRERAARVAQIETGVESDAPMHARALESPTMTAPNAGAEASTTPRGKRTLVVFVAVALALAVVVAIGASTSWRRAPVSVASAEPRPSAPSIASVVASVASASPSSAASAAPDPSNTPRTAVIAPRIGPSPKASAARSAARNGCNPMFTIDENGIRRVKPECL